MWSLALRTTVFDTEITFAKRQDVNTYAWVEFFKSGDVFSWQWERQSIGV